MKLQAQKRETSEKLSVIRGNDQIPAVVYGSEVASTPVTLSRGEFVALNKQVGGSSIVDLDVDGESHEVLIKQVDRDPVSEEILHVDLYAIKRGVEMEVTVPVVFQGEAPAEKTGGIVNEVMHELVVRCLPRYMPSEIAVDLSVLTEMDSQITIADLNLGEGVQAVAEETDTVVTVNAPVSEEETSVEDAQAAVDAVLADSSEESAE